MRRYCASFVLATLAFSLTSSVFGACVKPKFGDCYDIKHPFQTRLIGNQAYRAAWQWAGLATAQSTLGFVPLVMPPPGNAVLVLQTAPEMTTGNAQSGTALAIANSQAAANTDGSGFARVFGEAVVAPGNGIRATAQSSTTVGINRGVKDRNGGVTWSPNWSYTTAAGGVGVGLRDPIDITYVNLDNFSLLSSRLFDLDIAFDGSGGASSYVDGDLTISGMDGSFSLFMDSPYLTSGRGTIELLFAGGIITQSTGTGIYSGILPGVGSNSTAINLRLGDANGAFVLDFDFGSEPNNVNGYDFQALLGTSAFAVAVGVPEPATWVFIAVGCTLMFANRRRSAAS